MGFDWPSAQNGSGIELGSPLVDEKGNKPPQPRVAAQDSNVLCLGENQEPDGEVDSGSVTPDIEKGPAVGAAEDPRRRAFRALWAKFKVWVFILLWFAFNIGYNHYNKLSLNVYRCDGTQMAWAVALWQMAFGWVIFVPMWVVGLRKAPVINYKEALILSPSALGHLVTHVGAVVAFGLGKPSFGHIVKCAEPVVSSVLNFLLVGEVLKWPVYASLMPIIAGVGMASAGEMQFSLAMFGAAMASNLGSAGRAVYSKSVMKGGKTGENMEPANMYAVMTVMATMMLLPLTLLVEGPSAIATGFGETYSKHGNDFLVWMLLSGFFYYMYNEVAFMALDQLDPVSHAVTNTMKRVAVIGFMVIFAGDTFGLLGGFGSAIAITGTLLYSLAKNKFK
uniref:Sugar phosphate transporter domain-containing protein n=1 Tax=Zooxanthella nutricula TaxID=1333877 RepID=A0A7S2VSQ9_9DINO|mmetsp:Transcript_97980/g.299492  ORF Transcript_97980/g.299492 Transcript_97980/m.299492 type:complete len:392 (+) Transcript_97980:3-1178(+)